MVTISNLQIESSGFYLKPIDDSFDLTTVVDPILEVGGIKVKPELVISGIKNGFFYISQICNKHSLKIVTVDDESFKFETVEKHKDTTFESDCFYRKYKITDNIIKTPDSNRPIDCVFWDAPYRQLCKNWKSFYYEIEFQTWFQYQSSVDEPIIPILSLKWQLVADVEKHKEDWELTKSTHSSVDDIMGSVEYYKSNDSAIDPCQYKQIRKVVSAFLTSDHRIINGKC